jgi:hypothetical protein
MLKRTLVITARVALLLAVSPSAIAAQLAFDTPRMLSPHSPGGIGAQWVRAGTLPGDGDAFLVTWSPPGLQERMRLRGGSGTGAYGEASAFGGVDVREALATHRPGQPLDLAWIAGAGVGVGEYVLVTVPLGITAGRDWSWRAVWVAPYVGAGLALDYRVGDGAPDDAFAVSPSADVGVDIAFDPGRRFLVRAAASLGDRQSIALGALVRTGG